MPETAIVEDVAIERAEEMLAYLRLSDRRWGESLGVRWVFRGHSSSSWKLTPSAWRPDARAYFAPLHQVLAPHVDRYLRGVSGLSEGDSARARDRLLDVWAQHFGVQQFAELADAEGLMVPGGIGQFREVEHYDIQDRPPTEAEALARHHGIPTRLLDCTRNPLIAAYFAATGARDIAGSDERLAIWAIDLGQALASTGVPTTIPF